jgi:hypothetical protein
MKTVTIAALLAGLAQAHYAIKEVIIDGNK